MASHWAHSSTAAQQQRLSSMPKLRTKAAVIEALRKAETHRHIDPDDVPDEVANAILPWDTGKSLKMLIKSIPAEKNGKAISPQWLMSINGRRILRSFNKRAVSAKMCL